RHPRGHAHHGPGPRPAHLRPGHRRRHRRGSGRGDQRLLDAVQQAPERIRALLRTLGGRRRGDPGAGPPGGELVMNDFPWLTVLGVVPLVGALVTAFLPKGSALPKQVALLVSLAALGVAVAATTQYDAGGGMQLTETHTWIEAFGAHSALGVDGIGLTLVLLTAVLTPVVLLASWTEADERNPAVFMALMLAMEGLALFVFMAQDVFLFYVVFEATLIPAYFLIGSFGHGADRAHAAMKFLLYMLAGGLVMLASVVGLYAVSAANGTPTYLIS